MEQESEGGLIRRLFSTALQHMVGEYEGTQRDLAKEIGSSPSSLSDYVHGRREGMEEVRRRIATALGVSYQRMLNIGQMIELGHRPRDWEFLANENNEETGETIEIYRSVEIPQASPLQDYMIIKGIAGGIQLKRRVPCDSVLPHRRSAYVRQYSCNPPGRFDSTVPPEEYLAFRQTWIARQGGADKLMAFIAQDDLEEPVVKTGDIVVAKCIKAGALVSGKIYAVQLPEDPTIYMRTLVRIGASVSIPTVGVQYPLDDLNVIGAIVWVGREI